MKYPNFSEEKNLWSRGFKFVAGLDEVGRGPLAGPVVACAVIVTPQHLFSEKISAGPSAKIFIKNFGIRDSKKLTAGQREKVFKILTRHPQIKYGVGEVSEKIIDKINILEATKLAMEKALQNLDCKADYLILDGNFKINLKTSGEQGRTISQKSIVKGDVKVFSCAAASIIAKVTRDKIMEKYHKKYPRYNFKDNKGYGTAGHFACLKKYGPCDIHRRTFYPVRNFDDSVKFLSDQTDK